MSHVTVADAKSFANIYFDEKDAEVKLLVDAAEENLAQFLNRDDLLDDDLLLNGGDSPAPDSPGSAELKPAVKLLVLQLFNESWQNREIQVVGTILTENPQWVRSAHMFRKNLGV